MHLTIGIPTTFAIMLPESSLDFRFPGILMIALLAICGLVFAAIEIKRAGRADKSDRDYRDRL
jgi:hypothetical protein